MAAHAVSSRGPDRAGLPAAARARFGSEISLVRVGTPGDAAEREADRRAEAIESGKLLVPAGGDKPRQPAPAGADPGAAFLGSGRPLPGEQRAHFEQRLGHDLGRVRIHTDSAAAAAARSLHAHAFTWGHHVVFGSGSFAPGTAKGRTLLGHELTHVAQDAGPEDGSQVIRRHAQDPARCLDQPGWARVDARSREVWVGANTRIENHYKEGHGNNVVLTGSDWETGGRPGAVRVQLPQGAPNRRSGGRLLQQFSGISRQLAPDIMDFTERTFYEIKTASYSANGAEQLQSYYRLANQIAADTGDPPWTTVPVTWYPSHILAFPGDPRKRVCTEDTDFKRSGAPGLLIYEVQERTDDKQRQEPSPRGDQAERSRKVAEALAKLDDYRQRLANSVSRDEGEHRIQRDLIYKPSVTGFAGYVTTSLFHREPPYLMIWNKAYGSLARAEAALRARRPVAALGHLLQARREYLVALKQYTAWKDGLEGAATKMQITIGAVAVAAVLAFVAPTAVGAALARGAAATTGAAATEQTLIRIAGVVARADQAMVAAEAAVTESEILAQAGLEAEMTLWTALEAEQVEFDAEMVNLLVP